MKMQLVPASLISAHYFRISVRYFRIPLVTFAFPPVTFGFPHVTFGFRMLLSHFRLLLSGFHPLLSELPKVDCHLLSDPKVDVYFRKFRKYQFGLPYLNQKNRFLRFLDSGYTKHL